MKLTQTAVWLVLALALLASRARAEDRDGEKVRGAWKVVSAKATRGFEDNADITEYAGSTWTFGQRELVISKGKAVTRLQYALDPAKRPWRIDLGKDLKGKGEDRPYEGIYRLEGDRLTVCYTVLNVRPSDFSMGRGIAAEKHLVVLQRQAAKK